MIGRGFVILGCAAIGLVTSLGCRQQMADQPAYRPLQRSEFFADGRASRPIEAGTVARGQLGDTEEVSTGRHPGAATDNLDRDSFMMRVPVAVTPESMERGRERFTIFCSVCHDRLGTGNGRVVQRGFTKPPSLIDDLSRGFKIRGTDLSLRDVPDGYIFEVVSNGYGAMPDYREQIPVRDRWAIVAYVRALQRSQKPDGPGQENKP